MPNFNFFNLLPHAMALLSNKSAILDNKFIDYSLLHFNSWLKNPNDENFKNVHVINSKNNFEIDITTSSCNITNISWSITNFGRYSYSKVISEYDIDLLNSRENASSDFLNGITTVHIGDKVNWADDIGYSKKDCNLGYWPPGSHCPLFKRNEVSFTLLPAQELSAGK
jgi:hypothetical protein